MSGQPYRYASDPEKFRAEYMGTLDLQADINQMNHDANRTYIETGQLPAVSTIKDNRTTAEILADSEKLKADLRKEFSVLGDPNFIQNVIQGVESSPYNVDGSFFIFVAQRSPEIAKNLQKLYKYKIKGDTDDVRNFVSFMEDMYAKTKGQTQSVKSYFNRPVGASNLVGMTEGDLDEIKKLMDEVSRKLLLKAQKDNIPVGPAAAGQMGIKQQIQAIANLINDFKRFFSTQAFQLFSTAFLDANTELVALLNSEPGLRETFNDAYTMYSELIEEFPKADLLRTLINRLDRSIANADMRLSQEILTQIQGQLSSGLLIGRLTPLLAGLEREIRRVANTGAAAATGPLPAPPAVPAGRGMKKTVKGKGQALSKEVTPIEPNIEQLKELDAFPKRKAPAKPSMLDIIYSRNPELVKQVQSRMKGKGVYRESVQRNYDPTQGIEPSPRFVKFGKYLINNHKLMNEDVLALKRPSGGNISEFPSQRISKPLSHVIRKMVGGEIPTFNELEKLSEPERIYLHKITKKANIMDKFSIPTPTKDQDEKDIHKFEVMKGQILSGNDSKELIRDFKVHLLKLSRNGTLPKKEVAEILEELVELGF